MLTALLHTLRPVSPQSYIRVRGVVMLAVGVLVTIMSIIGCMGTNRQIQRDRESDIVKWCRSTCMFEHRVSSTPCYER